VSLPKRMRTELAAVAILAAVIPRPHHQEHLLSLSFGLMAL
jgi:hypothetical protein